MTSEPEERENRKTTQLYAKIVKRLLGRKKFTVIFRCEPTESEIKGSFFTDQKLEDIFLFGPTEVDRSYLKLTDPKVTECTKMQFFTGLIIHPEEKVVTFKHEGARDALYFHLALQDKEKVPIEIWQKAKKQVEEKEIYFGE